MKINFISSTSLVVLILVLFSACESTPPLTTVQQLQIDIEYLASDSLEGRQTGSAGEQLAADYIAKRYEEIGLKPFDGADWSHRFEFSKTNPHGQVTDSTIYSGQNILAYLDNGGQNTVIIGAHYDHLGHGISGSLDPESNEIHNGADDNASGIAGMLIIAEELINSKRENDNNYLFAAFSGEELGLYGSKSVANSDAVKNLNASYMLNFDMIGRLNEERTLVLNGTGTSPAWNIALDSMDTDLNLSKHPSGLGPSDHSSFYLNDMPVLHLFTGQHSEYHKPGDDAHLINYEGLEDITDFVINLIHELETDAPLAFTETKDEGRASVTQFKVGLGIMPDYTYNGKGMRIDKVLSDKVGDKAGLQDKDIIVQIGETEVEDIYSYMDALGKLEKGTSAQVVVMREDAKVSTTAKF